MNENVEIGRSNGKDPTFKRMSVKPLLMRFFVLKHF